MATHKRPETRSERKKKPDDDSERYTVSGKGEEEQGVSKGELSELLEEVEEMYKSFVVAPEAVTPKDCESKESEKVQPWRSRRLELKKGEEVSGSSVGGEECPWSPKQKGRAQMAPSSRYFQPRVDLPDLISIQPEWQEIDDLVQCMRSILRKPMYKSDARLSPEDEVQVRNVLEHHPRAEEKTGPGIDHIEIKGIVDEDTRCFWVVRTDGTEEDFSYHKCLKTKVAREFPELLEHYDRLYRGYVYGKREQRLGVDKTLTQKWTS